MPIILKENECVHCKTQEEYDAVIKIFNDRGFIFGSEYSNRFNVYHEKTCVRTNNDMHDIKYSPIDFYLSGHYVVYSFEEFMTGNDKAEKIYTQKEVDKIIAETRQKTIDEIIERLETVNSTDSLVNVNNHTSTSRCKTCGRFKSKSGKCKSCKK